MRQVYFLTFPHPHAEFAQDGTKLIAPDTHTRRDILKKVLDACAKPCYAHGHMASSVGVSMVAVLRELHAAEGDGSTHCHFHVALKLVSSFRFVVVKKALLARYGLATHWSCTHSGYWSPIRYCTVPSPSKTSSALDKCPLLWAKEGSHPPLHQCCHEPVTAAAMSTKRRRREHHAAEEGKPEPRMTEFELWPIVVESGIRNKPGSHDAHVLFMDYVRRTCSAAVCAFVFKSRARLPKLIDDIWRWDGIREAAAFAKLTRMDILRNAARTSCCCDGRWFAFASDICRTNDIDVKKRGETAKEALEHGRGASTSVVTCAGLAGGEGKSFLLKGLNAVYGVHGIFFTPQHASFPFLGLEAARVVFLDDFRFMHSVVPVGTLCLWLDGSPLPVALPQNQPGSTGHDIYEGDAPIFITTKLKDIDDLEKAGDGDASMILRRLEVRRLSPERCFVCLQRTHAPRAAVR